MSMRDAVVDSLATYRLTVLAIEDVITQPLRERIFEKHPPHENGWSYALTCPWCASMWIGLGVVVARRLFPKAWDPVALGLAASGFTGAMYQKLAE